MAFHDFTSGVSLGNGMYLLNIVWCVKNIGWYLLNIVPISFSFAV